MGKKNLEIFQKTLYKQAFVCYTITCLSESLIICGSGSVVERHLAKVNVASSNLVFRSINKRRNLRLLFSDGVIAKW